MWVNILVDQHTIYKYKWQHNNDEVGVGACTYSESEHVDGGDTRYDQCILRGGRAEIKIKSIQCVDIINLNRCDW